MNVIRAEQEPRSWLPSLRLIAWLREIFPVSVLELEEVTTLDDDEAGRPPT